MSMSETAGSKSADITIVGAGLVGSLLAISLAKRGFNVDIFERRCDMRKEKLSAGRSINLAVSTRGLKALQEVGLEEEVLAQAVAMPGRMVHMPSGEVNFQRYGKDDSEYINSVSRASLNKLLITKAEETGRVNIHFNHKCLGLADNGLSAKIANETAHETGNEATKEATNDTINETAKSPATAENQNFETKTSIVIGTDGSASALRNDMVARYKINCTESLLDYGYKELVIPPGPNNSFLMEKNALHIWPRGTFMLIALPNHDGSFTCTLFLPFKGELSFEKLTTRESVQNFFQQQFADAVPLLENLAETFFANPTGQMVTVKCDRWNVQGNLLLLGDASHAIVPFFGQGANAGFEDISVLSSEMEQYIEEGGALYLERRASRGGVESQRAPEGQLGWSEIFSNFAAKRVTDTNAIADMAVENFVEMRDKVADPNFILEKGVEKILQREMPDKFRSRYQLITFSNVPYSFAQTVGQANDSVLSQLCIGLKSPDNVDLAKAKILVDSEIAPLYAEQKLATKIP